MGKEDFLNERWTEEMEGVTAPALAGSAWLNQSNLPREAQEAAAAGKPLRFGREIMQPTLLSFWDQSCPHCPEVLARVHEWWEEYRNTGWLVIGVLSPRMVSETKRDAFQNAVVAARADYPCVLDPELKIWSAFRGDDGMGMPMVGVIRDGVIVALESGLIDHVRFQNILTSG